MTDDVSIDNYRCPYCSAEPYTSAKEREVRIHIEETADAAHKTREGFSPMTRVEAVDADGTVIEETDGQTVRRDPDEFENICDPDPDLSTTQQRIVATRMMHPDFSAEQIADFLDENGDGPHPGYVEQTLRDYFGTTETARGGRSYDEFTARQQAAIDAAARYKLDEFETWAEAAEAVDETTNYVNGVYHRNEEVVERRMEAIEEDEEAEEQDEPDGAETVRRENGTGTYTGPEEGIDATMQHISERSVTDEEQDKSTSADETDTGPTPEHTTDADIAAAREQVDLLRRLVENDELEAGVAFDEVERILAGVEAT